MSGKITPLEWILVALVGALIAFAYDVIKLAFEQTAWSQYSIMLSVSVVILSLGIAWLLIHQQQSNNAKT